LSREWQSPSGLVTNATPGVQYVYDDGSQGSGVAAYLRLTDVIYPNGRDLEYGYGTPGSTDDVLDQVAMIAGSDGTYAAYTYLGVDTIVTEDYEQPEVKLDYTNGSGQITGLDRFGRVVDQVWSDYGNSTTADEFKYGYDMSGNVAWKENAVSGSQSSPVHLDELYTYNGLDELTGVNRGELNTTHDGIETGTLDYSQSWTLDGLGNWLGFNDNGASETRTTDYANKITGIIGGPQTPAYDLAGNMTTMPQPGNATVALTCVYDAWDRLVQVNSGNTVLAQYQYDGADRLVAETANSNTTYSYYSGDEVIETRLGGTAATNVQYQYVWSLRGEKVPILRDTYSGGQLQSASRIYYTTDANSSVTALIGQVSGTWCVVERYVYDAYGTVTYYAHDWSSSSTDPQSTINAPQNTLVYAGLALDPLTGLQHADYRWYNSALATWTAQDPNGYSASGADLYCYCGDGPTDEADPTGFQGGGTNVCPKNTTGLGVKKTTDEVAKIVKGAMNNNPGGSHVVLWNPFRGDGPKKSSGAVSVCAENFGDAVMQLEELKAQGRCVAVLEITGHAHGSEGMQVGNPPTGHENTSGENTMPGYDLTYMNTANAEYVGQQLKPFLCPNAVIVLLGCNTGNSTVSPNVPSNLAIATGATVIAAGGFASGSFADGNASVGADYMRPPTDEQPYYVNRGTLYDMSGNARNQKRCNSQNDRFYQTNPPP
jgi:RHS repeat-associated protein